MVVFVVATGCGNDDSGGGHGTTMDGVTCSLGTPVGKASYATISRAEMLGDKLLVMGEYYSGIGGRNVLVIDHASSTPVDEWIWEHAGTLAGPPTAEALIAPPDTTRYPLDAAIGTLGPGTLLSDSQPAMGDARVLGDETHLVLKIREQIVLDATGALVRASPLPYGTHLLPVGDYYALLDDAIVSLGAQRIDNEVLLRRWNLQGELTSERPYPAAELGLQNVDNLALVRHGAGAAFVNLQAGGLEVRRIDAALELGPPITGTAMANAALAPQAGGFSLVAAQRGDSDLRVVGAHIGADDTITPVEVYCTHGFAAPPYGAFVPRDAPRPTWVFHVGSVVWVYTLGEDTT